MRLRALMWKVAFVMTTLGLSTAPDASGQAQGGGGGVDYIILVDISGSMVGLPAGSGNAVIFPQVKEALTNFIRVVDAGATITIWPFAGGLETPGRFAINSQADLDAAIQFVERLEATGRATWVYRSILDVFEAYNETRAPGNDRTVALMVFTDGLDNGPDMRNMQDVVDEFGLNRRPGDFLYYATLGIEVSAADRQALAEAPFAALVESPVGEVVPVVTIQPLLEVLDFGNLRVDGQDSRLLPLVVRGTPANGTQPRIRIQSRFTDLEGQGAFTRVEPEEVEATDSARLQLAVLNAQSIRGTEFEGYLELTSLDPGVVVAPSRVRTLFRWEAPRVLTIVSPCPTPETCDLGTLRPWQGLEEASVVLRLDADTALQRMGGNFIAEVFPDADLTLIGGGVTVNGMSGQTNLVDGQLDSMTISVQVPRDRVLEGNYGAWIRFTSSSADITGLDSLRIHVQVPTPPRTAGEWLRLGLILLLVLGAAVLVIRWATTGSVFPPKMRGQLDVLDPAEWQGSVISLAGLRRVEVGAGAPNLPSLPAGLHFIAMSTKAKGRFVRMKVMSGEVTVMPVGDRFGFPVSTFHDLNTEDRIVVGEYKISFQSY